MAVIPPYRITFLSSGEAELRSVALDPRLHPDGRVVVGFPDRDAGLGPGGFLVDHLQLSSVVAYLREQALVRRTAEAEFAEARANWLEAERVADPDHVWTENRVMRLSLPSMESNVLMGGAATDEAVYEVEFRVDWDDEHGARALKFRDGAYFHFGLPGEW